MTADAGHPIARLARDAQRTTVERANPREHTLHWTYMSVILALVGKRHAIGEGRHVAMNQRALYDFAQRRDVSGQRAELRRMRVHQGHRPMVLIVFLRIFHGAVAFVLCGALIPQAFARYSVRRSRVLVQPPLCRSRAVTDSKTA